MIPSSHFTELVLSSCTKLHLLERQFGGTFGIVMCIIMWPEIPDGGSCKTSPYEWPLYKSTFVCLLLFCIKLMFFYCLFVVVVFSFALHH